jgi:hypothetical protein
MIIIIYPIIDDILMKLIGWKRNTLRYLVQSEDEYNAFMNYYNFEEISKNIHRVKLAEWTRVVLCMDLR